MLIINEYINGKEDLFLIVERQLTNVRRDDGIKLEMHRFLSFIVKTESDRKHQQRLKG